MPKKHRIDVLVDKNAIVDDGEGIVRFNPGLTLSDESEQLNGTRYDLATMDISHFNGEVFAEHDYSVTSLLGSAFGVAKQAGRLVAEGIRFAVKESALARFYYNMLRGGYAKNVSIGTIGPAPDEDGVYHNAVLKEFSLVGLGNNENARVNLIAKNTIEQSEAEGLSTRELRDFLLKNHVDLNADEEEEPEPKGDPAPVETPDPQPSTNDNKEKDDMKFVTIKNGRKFAIAVKYKNANGDDTETELAPDQTLDVSEDQKDAVEKQLTDAPEPSNDDEDVESAVSRAVAPLMQEIADMKKQMFDNGATEPTFKNGKPPVTPNSGNSVYAGQSWQELTQLQVVNFWKATKEGDEDAKKELAAINKFNKEQLVEKGLAKNAVGLGDFGNFVTNPELITEIQGTRSDYSDLLSVFPYRETNSLKMGYLLRSGDIDMQSVEFCDDDEDGNLKPISDYSATPKEKTLEELAAVTVVCNAATIFLAADLLGDVAAGYRNSYDRNLARGVIAELEKAAEDHPSQSITYTGDPTDPDDSRAGLEEIRQAVFAASNMGNGVLVFSEATYGIIAGLLMASGNGGQLAVRAFDGGVNTIWSKRFVVVPNDLMPTLGNASTYVTFDHEGESVTVNHAIFYADPSLFRGRVNGGLRYDLSTEAAYEVDGEVRSAYQRNEVVLRGSHFRGTAYTDPSKIGAVRATTVTS